MWYHPNPSKESYKELLGAFGSDKAHNARRQFFKANPFFYSGSYGLCGGREKLIAAAFYDGYQASEGLMLNDRCGINHFRESVFKSGMPPNDTLLTCFTHSLALIKNPASCNPYAPGQYLWEASNFFCEGGAQGEAKIEKDFDLLKEIVSLVRESGGKANHERNIELIKYLYDSFSNRKFCDLILSVWDNG